MTVGKAALSSQGQFKERLTVKLSATTMSSGQNEGCAKHSTIFSISHLQPRMLCYLNY